MNQQGPTNGGIGERFPHRNFKREGKLDKRGPDLRPLDDPGAEESIKERERVEKVAEKMRNDLDGFLSIQFGSHAMERIARASLTDSNEKTKDSTEQKIDKDHALIDAMNARLALLNPEHKKALSVLQDEALRQIILGIKGAQPERVSDAIKAGSNYIFTDIEKTRVLLKSILNETKTETQYKTEDKEKAKLARELAQKTLDTIDKYIETKKGKGKSPETAETKVEKVEEDKVPETKEKNSNKEKAEAPKETEVENEVEAKPEQKQETETGPEQNAKEQGFVKKTLKTIDGATGASLWWKALKNRTISANKFMNWIQYTLPVEDIHLYNTKGETEKRQSQDTSVESNKKKKTLIIKRMLTPEEIKTGIVKDKNAQAQAEETSPESTEVSTETSPDAENYRETHYGLKVKERIGGKVVLESFKGADTEKFLVGKKADWIIDGEYRFKYPRKISRVIDRDGKKMVFFEGENSPAPLDEVVFETNSSPRISNRDIKTENDLDKILAGETVTTPKINNEKTQQGKAKTIDEVSVQDTKQIQTPSAKRLPNEVEPRNRFDDLVEGQEAPLKRIEPVPVTKPDNKVEKTLNDSEKFSTADSEFSEFGHDYLPKDVWNKLTEEVRQARVRQNPSGIMLLRYVIPHLENFSEKTGMNTLVEHASKLIMADKLNTVIDQLVTRKRGGENPLTLAIRQRLNSMPEVLADKEYRSALEFLSSVYEKRTGKKIKLDLEPQQKQDIKPEKAKTKEITPKPEPKDDIELQEEPVTEVPHSEPKTKKSGAADTNQNNKPKGSPETTQDESEQVKVTPVLASEILSSIQGNVPANPKQERPLPIKKTPNGRRGELGGVSATETEKIQNIQEINFPEEEPKKKIPRKILNRERDEKRKPYRQKTKNRS